MNARCSPVCQDPEKTLTVACLCSEDMLARASRASRHSLPLEMKRSRGVTDGNGFLRYHHAKKSKKEVVRPPDVGVFVDVMIPEIRACLYRMAPLAVARRLAQTCKLLNLELTRPNTGWIWLPTAWQGRVYRTASGRALQVIIQEYLRPRRFFERVTHAASVVQLSALGSSWSFQVGTWGAADRREVDFGYATLPFCVTPPVDAELDEFIAIAEKHATALTEAAKLNAKIPVQLRQARIDATKQRADLLKQASMYSRKVWLNLKVKLTDVYAARRLLETSEELADLDARLAGMNAKIEAIKAGEVLLEEDASIATKVIVEGVAQDSDSDT